MIGLDHMVCCTAKERAILIAAAQQRAACGGPYLPSNDVGIIKGRHKDLPFLQCPLLQVSDAETEKMKARDVTKKISSKP